MKRTTRVGAIAFLVALNATQAHAQEKTESPTVDIAASLTGVAQRINADGTERGENDSRATYRADVTMGANGIGFPGFDGKFFAHVRAGRGKGIALRPTYTSTTNSTSCIPADGADRSFAVLAQAWYQLSGPSFEFTLGKMDPFAFFDQNAIADDETVRFLNNAFVHQALLDSGGDIGSDRHGFAPGVRIAHVHAAAEGGTPWTASLATFSPGQGNPFVIAQVEASPSIGGLAGTYRVYAWRKAHGVDHDGGDAVHTGVGLSADQHVSDHATVFARLGRQMAGQPRFDRVVTLGAEIDGNAWRREKDAVGVAAGWLRSRSAHSGSERIAEVYYRFEVDPRLQLTTDAQWIRKPGADSSAPTVRALALRARIAF